MDAKLKVATLVFALIAVPLALAACAKYPVVVNASAPSPAAGTSAPAR